MHNSTKEMINKERCEACQKPQQVIFSLGTNKYNLFLWIFNKKYLSFWKSVFIELFEHNVKKGD